MALFEPSFKNSHRLFISILFSLYLMGTYLLVGHLAHHTGGVLNLELPGEKEIPFIPSFFIVYLAIYVIIPTTFLFAKTKKELVLIARLFLIASFVHYVFFIFLPVRYHLRPELGSAGQDWIVFLLSLFYQVDKPYNCFPSMHVSYAFLSFFCIRHLRPRYAHLFLFVAVAISLSTLFVKQHYVLDIFSAIILALILYRFLFPPISPQNSSPFQK